MRAAGPVDDIDLILFDTSQTEVLRLPLEFCFLNRADELGHIDELEVLLRKGAKPGTEAVYDEIMRAYFAPSDEVDADSYTTQRDHWRERAWAKAIEATEGDAAAHATELEQAASALRLRQRASETIIARINDEGVKIEVLKNTGSREATSRQTGEKRRNDDPAYRALVREERVLLDVSESLAESTPGERHNRGPADGNERHDRNGRRGRARRRRQRNASGADEDRPRGRPRADAAHSTRAGREARPRMRPGRATAAPSPVPASTRPLTSGSTAPHGSGAGRTTYHGGVDAGGIIEEERRKSQTHPAAATYLRFATVSPATAPGAPARSPLRRPKAGSQ